MVFLACWSLLASPEEVIYLMPPMTTKAAATTPPMPMNQLMAFEMSSSGAIHCISAQLFANLLALLKKAMWMEVTMTLARLTMARPMKAWAKVFLPAATLLVSPEAKT